MSNNLCRYYFLIGCIFIFLAAFTSNYANTYADYVCVREKQTATSNQSSSSNTTSDSSSVLSNVTSSVTNKINEVLSQQLTLIPHVLTGFYATEVSLAFLTCLLLFYYSTLLPRDFAKLGRILSCIGILLKISPKLIILLHYVILIIIFVMIG